jgi:predicted nucleic acid-binding protein
MTVFVDSSFLFALLNPSERQHIPVTKTFAQTQGPWLLPTPAVTEVAYLLLKILGPPTVALFLEDLTSSKIILVEPHVEDYRRAAQLVRQYQDAPLDLVDSVIVAIAER